MLISYVVGSDPEAEGAAMPDLVRESITSLDMPRRVVMFVSAASGVFSSGLLYRFLKSRVDTFFFLVVGIATAGSAIPFLLNFFVSKREQSAYLSALIFSLPATLAQLIYLGLAKTRLSHWLLEASEGPGNPDRPSQAVTADITTLRLAIDALRKSSEDPVTKTQALEQARRLLATAAKDDTLFADKIRIYDTVIELCGYEFSDFSEMFSQAQQGSFSERVKFINTQDLGLNRNIQNLKLMHSAVVWLKVNVNLPRPIGPDSKISDIAFTSVPMLQERPQITESMPQLAPQSESDGVFASAKIRTGNSSRSQSEPSELSSDDQIQNAIAFGWTKITKHLLAAYKVEFIKSKHMPSEDLNVLIECLRSDSLDWNQDSEKVGNLVDAISSAQESKKSDQEQRGSQQNQPNRKNRPDGEGRQLNRGGQWKQSPRESQEQDDNSDGYKDNSDGYKDNSDEHGNDSEE